MSDMITDLVQQGIRLPNHHVGAHKVPCPRCSHTRKDKKDPCLYVTVEAAGKALWKCFNCFWTGAAGNVSSGHTSEPAQREYKKPVAKPPAPDQSTYPQHLQQFLMDRGISLDVARRNRVYWNDEKKSICFPYYIGTDLVNVKYRTLDKKFHMEAGAKLTFYGLNDVSPEHDIIIVEGEFDKLALEMCGLKNVISVPNGAPARLKDGDIDNSGAFQYLMHSEELLKKARRVVIATDNDKPGEVLRIELARRIGAAKCWVVKWPDSVKDANECLQKVGVDIVLDCINEAEPYPIKGLYRVDDFTVSLTDYFNHGMSAGVPTGFENLDKIYSVMPGELTVVTGVPNSGKSEFIDALMINLSKFNDWKFVCFSPENRKEQHVAKLVEKIVGLPSAPQSSRRMNMEQFMSGAAWINKYFYFVVADDEATLPTLDWILEKATVAVYRYGIKGFLLDPWNEVEHSRAQGLNETEYVSIALAKIKRWARNHMVAVWIVAHPTKIQPDKDGKMRVPSLYDISGSANWVNKPDNGIVVFRSEDAADQTEIHIKKVRFKHVGRRGSVHLNYDKDTGRYSPPKTDKDFPDVHSTDPDMVTF